LYFSGAGGPEAGFAGQPARFDLWIECGELQTDEVLHRRQKIECEIQPSCHGSSPPLLKSFFFLATKSSLTHHKRKDRRKMIMAINKFSTVRYCKKLIQHV